MYADPDGFVMHLLCTAQPCKTIPPEFPLYDMKHDFNERVNVAGKYPQKVKELRAVFEKEAQKYHVYPLHDSWFPPSKFLQISDSRDKEAEQD